MKEFQIIKNGSGKSFDYSQDHVFVKLSSHDTNGELCVVEDVLKPGFYLARHHHKIMTEVFYIIDGGFEITFDDNIINAGRGDTITIQPMVWHTVKSELGAKLLTIFKNGRFDAYLEKMDALTPDDFKDEALMTSIAEDNDIFYE